LPVESTNIGDAYQDKYEKFSEEDKSLIHQLFFDPETKENIKTALKHIIFKIIPPTPEEFLDPEKGFLPASYIADLYPHVKEDFINAMRAEDPFSIICLYGATRTGKSLTARLFVVYTIIYVNYLRDPHYFYSVSQMSRLCIYLVSFDKNKTRQVYLDPLIQLLEASDKFKRERFELNVKKKGVTTDGIIHFSEASKFGSLTFPKVHIVCGSDASALVGADIICGAISELTFFRQYASSNLSDEDIMQVFTKLNSRIQNTVGRGSFPSWTYLDSSSNYADSPLEKMIINDFQYDPKVYFRWYTLWKLRPHLFPIYYKTGETFKVCIGGGDYKAKIINNEEELKDYPKDLIIDVPVDARREFEKALIDQIKDVGGYPTNSESKLISNSKLILDIFNNNTLQNIEGAIIAGSETLPEQLIWNQIKDKFYTCYDGVHYIVKRAQSEARIISFDNAFSMRGDVLGVCCLHKERLRSNNQIIYVIDFCFPLLGNGKEINLEAVPHMILDLLLIGQTPIRLVCSDSFQSRSSLQFLERNNITILNQSVDRTIDAYQSLLTQILNQNIKSGRNIFFKNNLDSLYRTKRASGTDKIDHNIGNTNNNYYGSFDTSDCGKNAKDVSDAVCNAYWAAYNDTEYQPTTYYEDENLRFDQSKENVELNIKNAYNKLHRMF